MVKLAGLLLIVLCSSMTGIFKASGLSDQVAWIENSLQLLHFLSDRLKYLQSSVESLLRDAEKSGQFDGLEYVHRCTQLMEQGNPFPQSWHRAMEEYNGGDREVLLILGELESVLGGMDLDSQLTALSYTRERIEQKLEGAREHRDRYGRLYRSLGVLCGLMIAIILI